MDYLSTSAIVITIFGAVLNIFLPYFDLTVNQFTKWLGKKSAPPSVEWLGGKSSAIITTQSTDLPVTKSTWSLSPAQKVLGAFAIIVIIYGILILRRYWHVLKDNEDSVYFALGLFLTMIAGMFVQVLASNYKLGNPLLRITASQLIFPLLFSIIVFYPIWAIAASATHSFFSIHAAFLNGYFWESVVSSAHPPKAPEAGSKG